MIILDATTKSIEAKIDGAPAANQLTFVTSYVDISTTTFGLSGLGEQDGVTNSGTAVTILAAPAASTARQLKALSVENTDTAARVVTVQYNTNSTIRPIHVQTLQAGQTLQYDDANGFTLASQAGVIPNPIMQSLLFTDNTYDIGGSASTFRPRDLFLSRNATIGGTLAVTGNITLSGTGNAVGTITSGVWNAGAVTSSGLIDISGAAAGQIKFPSTQNASSNANTLDDYEEGTWTPTLVGAGGGSAALTNKVGYYVKIGKVVFVQFDISATDAAALTGNWNVGGLPFTVNNDASSQVMKGVGNLDHYRQFPTSASSTGIVPVAIKNTTTFAFYFQYGGAANTEAQPIAGGNPSASLEFSGSLVYFTP